MAAIEKRGKFQYRVKIRRKGQTQTRTFETKSEAEDWAARVEGKIRGDEFVNLDRAKKTTVSEAIEWFLDRVAPVDRQTGERRPKSAHAKNQKSHGAYWQSSEYAGWSLASVRKADLISWRKRVLDEGNPDTDEMEGPEAEAGAQTVIHRLNFLSKVYNDWSSDYEIPLVNPVAKGCRPKAPKPRKRRLSIPDKEEARLLEACKRSESKWLLPVVKLALLTAMRQGEIRKLTWDALRQNGNVAYLPETKNGEERYVPLPKAAQSVLNGLRPKKSPMSKARIFSIETGDAVSHAFHKACMEATPPLLNLTFHDLRHEAISRLYEHTDLRDLEIAKITGHKSLEMLARYAKLRPIKIAEKIRDFGSPARSKRGVEKAAA